MVCRVSWRVFLFFISPCISRSPPLLSVYLIICDPLSGIGDESLVVSGQLYGSKILPVTVCPCFRYDGIYVLVHILLDKLLCRCQGMEGEHRACLFAVHIVFLLFQFLVESVTLVLYCYGFTEIYCIGLYFVLLFCWLLIICNIVPLLPSLSLPRILPGLPGKVS